MTKIKTTTLSKFEKGQSVPKVDMLLILCKKLECTPNQILGIDSGEDLDPRTLQCARIIQSMTSFEKQWVQLTLEGIQIRTASLKSEDITMYNELLAK